MHRIIKFVNEFFYDFSPIQKSMTSHYIRMLQVLYLSIVCERVRDSTKAYRPIYKRSLLDLYMCKVICDVYLRLKI